MDIRTERLKIVYVWLRRNKGLRTQKELADRIGVDQNTISRAMTGKIPASDDVLELINQSYGSPFNFAWMRGESNDQFNKNEKQHPYVIPSINKKESEQQTSIIELYAHLIQEVENLRRDLVAEIEQVQQLRTQLSDEVEHLRTTSEHISHIVTGRYQQADNQIPMAAESTT